MVKIVFSMLKESELSVKSYDGDAFSPLNIEIK